MSKKEYLLDILEKLEPVWDLASGLRILVQQWELWDDTLDTLIAAVESGVHSVNFEKSL